MGIYDKDQTMELFLRITVHRMTDHYFPKLVKALQAVPEDSLWRKESGFNSIGGIILHILEHLRRSTLRHEQPGISFVKGFEEQFPDERARAEELSDLMERDFASWRQAVESSQQSFDMHHLYHLVEHTGYHLGQILDRVQHLTKQPFGFVQQGLNEAALRRLIEQAMTSE